MTDNEIVKHFQSFCKELIAMDHSYAVDKPYWYNPYYGLCTNFKSYLLCWNEIIDTWLMRLFESNELDSCLPFNINFGYYDLEINKFTNPARIEFIRKYANHHDSIQ